MFCLKVKFICIDIPDHAVIVIILQLYVHHQIFKKFKIIIDKLNHSRILFYCIVHIYLFFAMDLVERVDIPVVWVIPKITFIWRLNS